MGAGELKKGILRWGLATVDWRLATHSQLPAHLSLIPSSGPSVSAHLNISQPSTRPTYNTNRPVWGNKWLRVAEHDSFNNPVNANEAQLSPGCARPKAEETLLAISRVLLANIHSLPASSSLSSGRRCVFLRRGQVFQVGLYYKDSDKDRLAPPGTSVLLCLLAFGFVFLM